MDDVDKIIKPEKSRFQAILDGELEDSGLDTDIKSGDLILNKIDITNTSSIIMDEFCSMYKGDRESSFYKDALENADEKITEEEVRNLFYPKYTKEEMELLKDIINEKTRVNQSIFQIADDTFLAFLIADIHALDVLKCKLEDTPLKINSGNLYSRAIADWRLKIGK